MNVWMSSALRRFHVPLHLSDQITLQQSPILTLITLQHWIFPRSTKMDEKHRSLEKSTFTVFQINSSEKCILIKNEITYLDPE